MTTGEQEHTRGDPRRGRPARYACCAPLAAYLLTRPLRPPGDTTRHPYTAAHPMAEDDPPRHHHQCKTTPPPPSGTQKPSAAAAYPEQQPPQRTHVTSSQRNRAPIQPLPRRLKTARHNATTNTEQPAPSRHVTRRGGPTHAQRTPTRPMARRTDPNACPADPQADTHTPCRRLPENNSQRQLLDRPLGHLTTPNRHRPPRALGPCWPYCTSYI
jgi:hypothetical protein